MQRFLKSLSISVIGLVCAIGVVATSHELLFQRIAQACGVERWSVKVGTDADRTRVSLTPRANTIATMVRWPYPRTIPPNNRIRPQETTTWVLTTTLVKFKAETDEDYHLVLADGSGNTMIAEIPRPTCVGRGSPLASGITNARNQFNARFTPSPSFQTVNVHVRITGVGFFDFRHGQTGSAPNQIELHPVIDIAFTAGAVPNGSVPDSPTDVTATGSDTQVVLAWPRVEGATSYTVYRGTTSGDEVIYEDGLTTPDFQDTDVINGTTYYYVVTASNASGESEPSFEISATPMEEQGSPDEGESNDNAKVRIH